MSSLRWRKDVFSSKWKVKQWLPCKWWLSVTCWLLERDVQFFQTLKSAQKREIVFIISMHTACTQYFSDSLNMNTVIIEDGFFLQEMLLSLVNRFLWIVTVLRDNQQNVCQGETAPVIQREAQLSSHAVGCRPTEEGTGFFWCLCPGDPLMNSYRETSGSGIFPFLIEQDKLCSTQHPICTKCTLTLCLHIHLLTPWTALQQAAADIQFPVNHHSLIHEGKNGENTSQAHSETVAQS